MEDQIAIRARILGYHMPEDGDPMRYMMAAQIIHEVRDPARPTENQKDHVVLVQHADGYRDPNRTIKELFTGSIQHMVPQCLVGSELSVAGWEFINNDEITFTHFHNVNRYLVAPGVLPDPSEFFEGEWIAPARAATVDEVEASDRRAYAELALQGKHGGASNPW